MVANDSADSSISAKGGYSGGESREDAEPEPAN